MRCQFLLTSAPLVLILFGAAGIAAAQQSSPAGPQQQQQQEKAQQTPSGKMGKEEPSSHAPSDKPADNSVFVNGALAVPGAPANTDTVPAKFSQKNTDDDKLIMLAYTFKLLTDEQRRAIYEGLKGERRTPDALALAVPGMAHATGERTGRRASRDLHRRQAHRNDNRPGYCDPLDCTRKKAQRKYATS
jgi:hypothetical protein